jgi:hypothetical protein
MMDTEKKTFVLVHGARHGGWWLSSHRGALRKMGHEVFTPTHTGVGERAHQADESITARSPSSARSGERQPGLPRAARASARGIAIGWSTRALSMTRLGGFVRVTASRLRVPQHAHPRPGSAVFSNVLLGVRCRVTDVTQYPIPEILP